MTGELIGYEYLLNQSITLPENNEDEEAGEAEDVVMEKKLITEHRAFTDGIDDGKLFKHLKSIKIEECGPLRVQNKTFVNYISNLYQYASLSSIQS